MSEMLERAARAVFKTHHEATIIGWDELSEQAQEEFMSQARAVIEAMREPTAEMWKAEHPTWTLGRPMWDWWRGVIDAALSQVRPSL
jgi:hypothetical protein